MDFSKKIKEKKRIEKNEFLKSFSGITESVFGEDIIVKKDFLQHKENQIKEALNQITDYYKMERIKISRAALYDENIFESLLNRFGFPRRKITLKENWWKKGSGPCMAKKNTGEIIALIPKHLGGYFYKEPNSNKKIYINRKTSKEISRTGYCFYRPFPARTISLKDLLNYIIKTLAFSDILFMIFFSIVVTMLGLILPIVTKTIYSDIIPSGTISDIFPFASLLIGITAFSFFCTFFQSLWLARIGDKIQFAAQGATWIRILALPLKFFKKFNSGDLSARTNAISEICTSISAALFPTILIALFSFIYLFQIYVFAEDLVIPSLLIILLTLVNSLVLVAVSLNLKRKQNKITPKLSGFIFQILSGISKIRVAGAEIHVFSKWANIYAKLSKSAFNPPVFYKISESINKIITILGTGLIYFLVYQQNIEPADYIAFSVTFGSFSAAILKITTVISDAASLKPQYEMIEPILKEIPEIVEEKVQIEKLFGAIDISHLTFKYAEDGPLILDDLNIDISAGEYVAIVGSTGCGKSTLFKLLLGFENPVGGGIYFDKQNLEYLDLHSVRKKIGVVLQNGQLFSESIYENIIISNPTATQEEAWKAAQKAGFDNDIKNMPMQMQTLISGDGSGLSGGQKQKLLIARALLGSPDILMFDEATSALDNIAQAAIIDTLSNMNITRIVIAHRLSTIKGCDRIIFLEKGKVAEEGTYEELMQKNGLFAKLARRQLV